MRIRMKITNEDKNEEPYLTKIIDSHTILIQRISYFQV
jgi:hypothetical protein